jgi:hypothetical protein
VAGRVAVAVEGDGLMAPRRRVEGREAAKLVRETRQERIAREAAERVVSDREARLRANEKYVAATGKPMPQGGAHRRRRGDA